MEIVAPSNIMTGLYLTNIKKVSPKIHKSYVMTMTIELKMHRHYYCENDCKGWYRVTIIY